MLRLAVPFSIVAVLYDALAALLAKAIGISYDSFVVPAVVLFVFMGVYAGRKSGDWSGFVPVLVAALVHATLGWYVAALVGPGRLPQWTTAEAAYVLVGGAFAPLIFGAAGVAAGIRAARA